MPRQQRLTKHDFHLLQFVNNNQVLATLPGAGVGQNLITLAPCGINQPHVHPRGTEISHITLGKQKTCRICMFIFICTNLLWHQYYHSIALVSVALCLTSLRSLAVSNLTLVYKQVSAASITYLIVALDLLAQASCCSMIEYTVLQSSVMQYVYCGYSIWFMIR